MRDYKEKEFQSWADVLPKKQGLYDPENEKDSCGVGFVVSIKGERSNDILAKGKPLLCNMTHRGAVSADPRDGDGAGVMTGIPYEFFAEEIKENFNIELPPPGQYAAGNVFFNPEKKTLQESKEAFEGFASDLGLIVLCWRVVPTDNSMLGPSTLSKEPAILQPFITLASSSDNSNTFDMTYFERQLFFLRKQTTHALSIKDWFYICSLSNKTIVYKGLFTPVQVYNYYRDLNRPNYLTHFALVHSRFSTNTFPSWDRAQPMRWCAHNGEINTLRGNKNWMRAREGVMKSAAFGKKIEDIYPIIEVGGSDSAAFDNVLELLVINGALTMPEAIMIMIPEATSPTIEMETYKRDFYRWASCIMEPWDGPALFTFSDGRYVGANLDRNGLRPCRYYVTKDDIMICASEVGAVTTEPEDVTSKGRLMPGRMLLVDTQEGKIIDDGELKKAICNKHDFGSWIENNMIRLGDVVKYAKNNYYFKPNVLDNTTFAKDPRAIAFGYTHEQINMLFSPIFNDGKEALGSMGNDQPLACLSLQPRLPYDYFRELFAQVTNPPIDPIREEIIMSLGCAVGPEGNILEVTEEQCQRLFLPSPFISIDELSAIKDMDKMDSSWKVKTIDITYPKEEGIDGYIHTLDRICEEATQAINEGYKIAVLSDRNTSKRRVSISTLIAVGGVHHHLVRHKLRSRIALIAETAEAREVHHFCVLVGYGADGICPYLALEIMFKLHREGLVKEGVSREKIVENYRDVVNHGILKVMSKMGISTLQSYKGAQIFEALGVDSSVVNRCFVGTASRIKGVDFEILAIDALYLHDRAWPTRTTAKLRTLPESGDYHWRHGGEYRVNTPKAVAELQDAVRNKNDSAYKRYSEKSQEAIKNCTLRGLLEFKKNTDSIPIEFVEPWTSIVKRFCTGAMSYGSISYEAHTTLAIAMNRLGGKSNTGEGGEDPERFTKLENGDSLRSAIKQVASGRFGVTSHYLSESDELQIKMAQGAKPGEGGELPGHKVSESIGKTRHSTPGVGLISPPPHHDIYSIEDLKQLIYDLKCSNPNARVSVKLVSEVGVGIVASGVAKAKADHILISGHDGGTGASRLTGIKYAGLPWELGLAETHQTLVLNDLRGRVVVQTDGQLKTGRDVAIACLLGAEEFGFATAPLISMGCTMMRKCHLNSCPVGIATQDPELRKRFKGQPEHVINFFYYVAEELREIMAKLGFRTVNEMVGRSDMLKVSDSLVNPKAMTLDLAPILTPAYTLRPGVPTYCVRKQDHTLWKRLDNIVYEEMKYKKEKGRPIDTTMDFDVVNTDRAIGTTVSYHISKEYKEKGLPEDTIVFNLKGSAGQSLGAFLAKGVTIKLEGDSNDYVGKGLSGGRIIIFPPKNAIYKAEENIIVGNVCLYGATSGEAYINGVAAERFCVRNSGATAVVEGVGDHGCEYMTGGRCIIIGSVGRNFAAGMSGGIAYVYDPEGRFPSKCNMELVGLEQLEESEEIEFLKNTLTKHVEYTGSSKAKTLLEDWENTLNDFVKVMPVDYKKILEKKKTKVQEEAASAKKAEEASKAREKELEKNKDRANENIIDIEDLTMGPNAEAKKDIQHLDKIKGFMKYKKEKDHYRPVKRRINDWKEVSRRLDHDSLKIQSARCMDCGIPFCQSDTGCPLGNIIPKFNELVFKEQWKEAFIRLTTTSNFPEFTGRVCPALCEGACCLGAQSDPVSVKSIEAAIIDRAWEEGWIVPTPPSERTGKRIAIIGSGPSGLAAADQLNKAGHSVIVYERNDRIGGLLMYGIPNMKLDKEIVQRRVDLMAAEGVKFITNAHVGKDLDARTLQKDNDALLICTGSTHPRDLKIKGRELNGIYFAMEYLERNTKSLINSHFTDGKNISVKDMNVIVIGGGDTGNDCIGSAIRQGAKSVTNFELLPQPSKERTPENPWPQWPRIFRVDYGHEEAIHKYGKDPREYCIMSKEFVPAPTGNRIAGIKTVRVDWSKDSNGKWVMKEIPDSEKVFPADIVFLSMGFTGPEDIITKQLGVQQDKRTNIITPKDRFQTSIPGVFAAGDCRRGQSLVVWGVSEGRRAAREIDLYLMGNTVLPVTGGMTKRAPSDIKLHIDEAPPTANQNNHNMHS
ncbi:NADH/NADPH, small subunit of glutamate synthase [Neocallimastix californiae]|jgi:glutamate synthase (NADPH/NADH)|uniref:Glutamate synthase [NADH] n=1 Tax=Neocallimastix californiae TaxID=1754190 RepID=A0A1Y2ERQ6_9FUNG|nr:NADH/NADPH, small subunit of glutamate synthase [Neocallimastix californiae]|eukprot:ORY73525.1 NADH/NADPH, small subunit of glutamate synthase [Neocallimastix californiae]